MRAYSVDLRKKFVDAVLHGRPKAEVVRIFGVGISSVKRFMKIAEEGGPLDPRKAPGKKRKLDESGMKLLEEDLRARSTATYEQKANFLDALLGVRVSKSTICRATRRLGYTEKRSVGASERDEWLRAAWRTMISTLDGRRLVFVDERGTYTSLTPLYAYSLRGHRVHAKVPRNRGPNTTLLASITAEGMGPCVAVVGSTTKEVFETYIEQVLSPTLGPGRVVVMDNLAAHKGERMQRLIKERGCELLYLPPYSPDLKPIEEAFSKVKARLRRTGARSRTALLEALATALSAVTSRDARGFFEHCGYRLSAQPL